MPSDLRQQQENFVRGELQALTWVMAAPDLSKHTRANIFFRIEQLKRFLSDPLHQPDYSGTVARAIPKFGEGE